MRKILAVLARYLNPRRRLYFTREGWLFSFIALSIGLVAINTGHNLFYLIFALLLSFVVVSGLLSERVLKSIEVRRLVPQEITAGVPFAVTVEVSNPDTKRIFYSLAVSDAGDFFPRRALGYIASLGAGEKRSFYYLTQVENRGLHRFAPLYLITRFPFGLFEKVRIIPRSESFVAYPSPLEVPALHAAVTGMEYPGMQKKRLGEEILSLRAALPEDDQRLVHWRTSARLGQLMVKEFVEELEHPRPIFFDSRGPAGEGFERSVRIAASLVRALAAKRITVSFATWESRIAYINRPEGLRTALRHLALISASPATPPREGFDEWVREVSREGKGIFLRGVAAPPASLPPCQVMSL